MIGVGLSRWDDLIEQPMVSLELGGRELTGDAADRPDDVYLYFGIR